MLRDGWQTNAQAWVEQLRTAIVTHRNIGHDWQFNDDRRKLLQQYYQRILYKLTSCTFSIKGWWALALPT
ncbi:NACHT C-terminal helical domain 2-containing protein [Scytonema sp. NUACC21]